MPAVTAREQPIADLEAERDFKMPPVNVTEYVYHWRAGARQNKGDRNIALVLDVNDQTITAFDVKTRRTYNCRHVDDPRLKRSHDIRIEQGAWERTEFGQQVSDLIEVLPQLKDATNSAKDLTELKKRLTAVEKALA